MFGSFLLLTLYMQEVLRALRASDRGRVPRYSRDRGGDGRRRLRCSSRVRAKLVTMVGLSLLTAGALWYTQIDVDGSYPADLLPGFLVVGVGIPFAYIPITIAGLAGVADREAGLASGLLNTSQQVGGAIGVAVISTVAFTHFETLVAERNGSPPVALTEGFQWGFWLAASIWATGLLAAAVLIRRMEIPAGDRSALPSRSLMNRLASETSPYLLQHADNPVDWYPWGDEAFERARAEDKPILLSVGYSACHWCHVMAHESFEDADDGRADERALRQRQGRPRGAARRRRDLHGRGRRADRPRRLADDGVPHARRASRSSAARTSRRSRGTGCRASAQRARRGLRRVPRAARRRRRRRPTRIVEAVAALERARAVERAR